MHAPRSPRALGALSKSDFLAYRECPKDLWLRRKRPLHVAAAPPSDFDRLLMEDGYAVEAIALESFRARPDAHLFEFQVTITDGRCLVRVDALRRNPDGTVDIFEVKSSTSPKDHLVDACFQAVVASRAGLVVRSVSIVHVSADYRLDQEFDASRFLVSADVGENLSAMRDEVEAATDEAIAFLELEEIDEDGCDCILKSASRRCSSFTQLNPDVPHPSAHTLPRMAGARLARLVDEGRLAIDDVAIDDVTASQVDTLRALQTGEPVIRKGEIASFLSALEYPIHFYDYETAAGAIPMAQGHGPHQQIPVQFSAHVLHEDGTLEHHEFLADDHGMEDKLVEHLAEIVGPVGSLVVWNESFEKSCNRRMADLLPQRRAFLEDVNERTVDLMVPYRKAYIHPGFEGSASIKKVLPVVCPDLRYDESSVHDGTGAILAFREMAASADSARRAELAEQLRAYCRLDTLAMVRLLQFLHDQDV